MNAFARLKKWGSKAVRLAPKAPRQPERVFGSPRKMTGFLATLTPEQRERALGYRGDDTFGDEALKSKT